MFCLQNKKAFASLWCVDKPHNNNIQNALLFSHHTAQTSQFIVIETINKMEVCLDKEEAIEYL